MAGEFKSGAMVMLLRASNRYVKHLVGTPRILGSRHIENGVRIGWRFAPEAYSLRGNLVYWSELDMRVIDPGAGDDETLEWLAVPGRVVEVAL